ncbi:uncharacterized protein LOC127250006 isoform X2 [Andrographis paniculata]|uniref:uncharacterized protein LOC127250006 isoform X2 n=1 Tax=Andrographis paniculata TaxID=175694 RepID=UPI0021E6FDDA|nr:uncharacterized protein LOC127250006 isoform X2 [Andrographis paniculata]
MKGTDLSGVGVPGATKNHRESQKTNKQEKEIKERKALNCSSARNFGVGREEEMPSGAKKRKAAKKKKKENQPKIDNKASSSSTHSYGNEGLKQQERDVTNLESRSMDMAEMEGAIQADVTNLDKKEDVTNVDVTNLESRSMGTAEIEGATQTDVTNLESRSMDIGEEKEGVTHVDATATNLDSRSMDMAVKEAVIQAENGLEGRVGGDYHFEGETMSCSDDEVLQASSRNSGDRKLGRDADHSAEEIHTALVAGDVPEAGLERNSVMAKQAGIASVSAQDRDVSLAPCVAKSVVDDRTLLPPQCGSMAAPDTGATAEKTSWKSCCGLFDMFSRTVG